MTPQKVKQMQTALVIGLLALTIGCAAQRHVNQWAKRVNAHCQQNGGKDACLTYPACDPDGVSNCHQ